MNFFIADVQTGFGAFVAFYLAGLGWSPATIGVVLAVGGIVGVLSQAPGGAVADAVPWKRGLAAIGIAMIGAAALILAAFPYYWAILVAEIMHGATAGVLTPAIGAISLGLVGHRGVSVRAGRNYRYAAAGHAFTAGAMGLVGAYVSIHAIFLVAAALCIPALIALGWIRSREIDYRRARNAGPEQAGVAGISDLVQNRKLLLFAAAAMLFQLADASMLPLISEGLAVSDDYARPALWMSALLVLPQIVVAVLAPWVGLHAERSGRRGLMLVGFGLEPFRAALLATASSYPLFAATQFLDGITGAIVGVMTILIVADATAGSGRFNLAFGAVGALSGIAASISRSTTGFLFQEFGRGIGFLVLAAVAATATAVLWKALSAPEPARRTE